ncbi:unnamed protein product [Prorocentrum cordatum]|uniref:Uncharacterized protein n=1 Tax=Prorocentrum cordatum TaxID=2364126 RepID=A0ABN9TED8_9DINO|nr:unnamed protein product [Polarella glacialis]
MQPRPASRPQSPTRRRRSSAPRHAPCADAPAAAGKRRGRPKKKAKPSAALVDNWNQVCESTSTFPAEMGAVTGDCSDWNAPVIFGVGLQEFAKFELAPARADPGRCRKKLKQEGSTCSTRRRAPSFQRLDLPAEKQTDQIGSLETGVNANGGQPGRQILQDPARPPSG